MSDIHSSAGLMSLTSLFGVTGEALVTGANGCIGLSLVEGLCAAGADIIAVQIDEGQQALEVARRHGRKAYVYVCDQSDRKQVDELLPKVLADGHDPRVFISCTGINIRGTVLDFKDEWLDKLFQVNVTSQFSIAREFARYRLSKSGGAPLPQGSIGKIIFLASSACYFGGVAISGYAMSKSAVLSMVRSMSNEFAPLGIQVNALAPGYVDTTFTSALSANDEFKKYSLTRIPAGRWAIPDDMAATLVFLASQGSNYVSGQAITIDGGLMVR